MKLHCTSVILFFSALPLIRSLPVVGDLPETPTTDFAAGDYFAAEELLSLAATTSQKVASSSGGHSKAILGAILGVVGVAMLAIGISVYTQWKRPTHSWYRPAGDKPLLPGDKADMKERRGASFKQAVKVEEEQQGSESRNLVVGNY